MSDPTNPTHVVFDQERLIARAGVSEAARAAHRVAQTGGWAAVFDTRTGAVVDLDLRGTEDEAAARVAPTAPPVARGRPRLGVTAREVTLLPRHWEWLAVQPGGASAALRRLVEEASRAAGASDRRRARRDAAYRFMSAMCGDRPGFEEASRALFADRRSDLDARMAAWPEDVARQIGRMLDEES